MFRQVVQGCGCLSSIIRCLIHCFFSITLIKPYDIFVLLMFICMVMFLWRPTWTKGLVSNIFLVILYYFMHKLVFISTYIYSVNWWFVISFVCRVFGALGQAHWLHQQIWGFRSTFWAFPELSSPFKMPT